MKTSLQIPTSDNLLLPAFLFEPESSSKGSILICIGMGIPKEFYERNPFEIYHNDFNQHPEKKCRVDMYIPVE